MPAYLVALVFCSLLEQNTCGIVQVGNNFEKQAICVQAANILENNAQKQYAILMKQGVKIPPPYQSVVKCLTKKQATQVVQSLTKREIGMTLYKQKHPDVNTERYPYPGLMEKVPITKANG